MTARECFKAMQEPFQTQAIRNTDPEELEREYDRISLALECAFIWAHAPEGDSYWIEYHTTLINMGL